jgi:hypothetical protein
MRAKQKQARGQFLRRCAGWAVHVLSFIVLLAAVNRVIEARTQMYFNDA